jgi:hypothetical protein
MHTTFANRLPHAQDVGVGRTLPIGGTVVLDDAELTDYQAALIEDGALEETDAPADGLHLDYRAPDGADVEEDPDSEPIAKPTPAAPKPKPAAAKAGGAAGSGSVSGDEGDDGAKA